MTCSNWPFEVTIQTKSFNLLRFIWSKGVAELSDIDEFEIEEVIFPINLNYCVCS